MTHTSTPSRSPAAGIAVTAIWVVTYFGCRVILEKFSLGTPARIAVAVAPVVPFIAFLLVVIASLRSLDELHRRVQFEALAFAFPSAIVLLMLLGLLQLAIPLPPHRFAYRDIWPMLPVLYFIGLGLAWRRYR